MTKQVTSRLLTFFELTGLSFNLSRVFIGTNVLTKFRVDWPINVANIAPATGSHVFQQTVRLFELDREVIRTSILTWFHKDWTLNVTSSVLTKFYYSLIMKMNRHQAAIKNVLTKFHDDWTINVSSRVLTRIPPRPPGGFFFQPTGTIFNSKHALPLAALKTDTLPVGHFHEDWTKMTNVAPCGDHFLQQIITIFELIHDIILTKILTRFYYNHIWKTPPPPGGHVIKLSVTIFELVQDIIRTHVLTKIPEGFTINVAS
ncbi:hypothetical protein DPMN_086808 [Dreissena polymorpha]|uniref:Uncharacterized protein n=1 Tax=Dreissena polymorpha TaxID=45954 RepID=A0A9D4KS33_DREPO|nr:hypothetical protein DPMN_086808 [Dreissena polymorpha]